MHLIGRKGCSIIVAQLRHRLAALRPLPWSILAVESGLILQKPAWLNRGPQLSDRDAQSGNEYGHLYRPRAPALVLRSPVGYGLSGHKPCRAKREYEERTPAWCSGFFSGMPRLQRNHFARTGFRP